MRALQNCFAETGIKMNVIFKTLIACLVLLSCISSAQAGERDYSHPHHKNGMSFGIVIGGAGVQYPVRYYRPVPVVRGCSARQASVIAREYGIRFQTVHRHARTMTVIGYRRGHYAKICFSRAPDCHIIR